MTFCTPPDAPLNLVAESHPINESVALFWNSPVSCEDNNIEGYVITRAEVLLSEYTVIAVIPMTATYYEDTTIDVGIDYNYIVYSFNSAGASAGSNVATYISPLNLTYLVTDNGDFLVTDSGDFLVT